MNFFQTLLTDSWEFTHLFIDLRFLCLHSRKNPIQTEWTLANFVLQHLQ